MGKDQDPECGHGDTCPAVSVGANAFDSVNEFISLGSKVTTDGHSAPEVMRRIALAASAMNQLGRVLRQSLAKSCYKTPPVRVVRPVCPLVLR